MIEGKKSKHEFEDLMGVTVDSGDAWLNKKLNKNVCYKKGGGQPTQTTSTVTQTNLPEYVQPYFERLLGRTESESRRGYTPYQAPRIAAESDPTMASRQYVMDIAGSGIQGLPEAAGRTMQAMQYRPEMFGGYQAQQYVSPYIQQVIARQQEGAIRDYERMGGQRGAEAVAQGAYGGSRQAVQEGLAREALGERLSDIRATGLQTAFEQAQTQFGRDRDAQIQAEQLGLAGAGQLAELGQAARAGDVQAATLLEQIGKDISAREQAALDMAYEDFVRQRDFPKEQLQFYSSILRGVPIQPSSETSKFQAYNPIQQLLGTGIAGLGAYKALTG